MQKLDYVLIINASKADLNGSIEVGHLRLKVLMQFGDIIINDNSGIDALIEAICCTYVTYCCVDFFRLIES